MAANLQPITSDGGFASGGNININNGGNIVTTPEQDLSIIVQDSNDDGLVLRQVMTDGTDPQTSTELSLDAFSIYTDVSGVNNRWEFSSTTLQTPATGAKVRGFDANVIIQSMYESGNGTASLQSISNINDPNVFATFDATPTGANIKVYNGGSNGGVEHAWQFDNDGNLTLPDTSKVVGLLTSSFTGTIAGTTLTVTDATPGTIAWEQSVEGPGVAADTFIITQLTGTSGGNGTYSVTVSQNVGPVTMNVAAMYLNGSLKLGVNHAIYQQDEDDATLYNFLIGIEAQEGTIHIGDINTNGVCIPNDKEYKGHSILNPGTFMSVGKVDSADQVILSSGNAANTLIRVGGDSTTTGYGMKLVNGGQALIPVGLRIGDNVNSSIFAAPLEVGSILGAAANNQSSPGGIALPTYRGTGTVIANDEWGSYIYGSRYRGTINTPLPVKDGDWLMEFGSTAFDGTNNNGGGEMAFRVDGTVTGSANPSRWELYVTPAGANTQTLGLKVDSTLATTAYGPVVTPPVPYANLTAIAGGRAFINNGNLVAAGNFGSQVIGGGSNVVPVWSDGTNWYIG
jgi:hypothetical protein